MRFNRSQYENDLSDIYDGSEYKRHQDFLSQPGHVSLTFNTDGVAVYRSSQVFGQSGLSSMSYQLK